MTERTHKDYVIEFGEYLAKAAEQFMDEQNRASRDVTEPKSEYWTGLLRAIYDFRKVRRGL